MPHDVFISYSSQDKAITETVCAALEAKGLKCWIAPRDVKPGSGYASALVDGIARSKVLLLILSTHSNASQQVVREVERAVTKNIPIIPFRIEDVALSKAMEYFVSSRQWLDAVSPPLEKHLDALGKTMLDLLSKKEGAGTPANAAARPSRGTVQPRRRGRAAKSRRCPACGQDSPGHATFCGECGRPLPQPAVCPDCGEENPENTKFCHSCGRRLAVTDTAPADEPVVAPAPAPAPMPTSFVSGRYQVKSFLGEGGKKKVYLAYDTVLARDVAFALIKTEGLDDESRTRVVREAQAMGRLGSHHNIVTVFDLGEEQGQPYIVTELLQGGDIESLISRAPEHRLPIDQVITIASSVCKGLSFSHAKGIVHRDLKPSNVWLDEHGIAKIGDFGLAAAVEHSRLTGAGMIVGTVSYLPPEQAMGLEVTPQADLYSLGAMLYEMVTGRPPFVGDDAVGIIGQHLNTPPVSPSWHRADLPAALETLILQLLEKEPANRPKSAEAVLQALSGIEEAKPAEKAPESATGPGSPIYRRVFVGREAESRQLQTAFDEAVSGKGGFAVVVGEPGIGKTSLCEQLATYVTLRGGKTLVGHCHEAGSLSLPYLAFVEALRSYVLGQDVDHLKKELGTGAQDVARIVSEVREKLKVEPRAAGTVEEERYRLLQAVSDFLTNASGVQPVLVVLEDLHDADKGTLEMLVHVSRNLAKSRLLVVGTYRDVEVDRTHPLSGTLAELRRGSSFLRVSLRGLTAEEVQRMITGLAGQEVRWSVAEAIHRQTEGNPLFVQEVLRHLIEEGATTREDGKWKPISETTLAQSIPEGLRDAIGKRLSKLSPECNRVLSVAAVIGREFSLAVLRRVSGLDEEELYAALDDAKAAAVVEERAALGLGATYRFGHAFFRQTLYEEMIAPRRIRLHQQVGRAIEEVFAKRLEDHAAELAEHLAQSTDPTDLAKAVGYGEMAAKKAVEAYAYGEAVRLLRQALEVQEVLDPEDKVRRCDLLLAIGDALLLGGEPRRYLDVEGPHAYALAEAAGDDMRAARAALSALSAIHAEIGGWTTPEGLQWTARADRHAPAGTVERVWADIRLTLLEQDQDERMGLIDGALSLARQIGNNGAICMSGAVWLYFRQHFTAKELELADELAERPRTGRSLADLTFSMLMLKGIYLTSGLRQRYEKVAQEVRELTQRTKQVNMGFLSMTMDAEKALLDGRLEEAERIKQDILSRSRDLGIRGLGVIPLYGAAARIEFHLGIFDVSSGLDPRPLFRAWFLAQMGRNGEANHLLEATLPKVLATRGTRFRSLLPISVVIEAAALTGNRQALEKLLACYDPGLEVVTPVWYSCVDRHLGAAHALLGHPDEAREHYRKALKVATDMRFRPEIALTRFQLAELLLEHYPDERVEAVEHLDFAIGEFREMKMAPSLEKATKLRESLEAREGGG